jgi:hypothetical protein
MLELLNVRQDVTDARDASELALAGGEASLRGGRLLL